MVYEHNSNRNTLMYMMRMSLMTLTRGRPGAMNSPIQTVPFSKYDVRYIIITITRVNYLSLPCSNFTRNKILELQKKNNLVVDHTKNIVGHVKLEEIDDFSETILYQDLWISWE